MLQTSDPNNSDHILTKFIQIAVHRISQKLSKAELQIEFDLDKGALPRPTQVFTRCSIRPSYLNAEFFHSQEKVESIAKRKYAVRVIPHVCTDALPVWDRETSPGHVGQIEPTSPLVCRLLSPAPLGPEKHPSISMPAHTTVFLDRDGNLSFNPVPIEESTEPSIIRSKRQTIRPAEKSSSRASPKQPIGIVSHEGANPTPYKRARLVNKRTILSDDESVVDNPIGCRKIVHQVYPDLSATVSGREHSTALNRNPAKGKELNLLPTSANPGKRHLTDRYRCLQSCTQVSVRVTRGRQSTAENTDPASKVTAENHCTSAQGIGKISL
jgi:hypothetical protein